MIKLECKIEGIGKALDLIDRKKVKRALRLTLEELGKGIRTQATKEIASEYNVKQKDLRSHIQVGRATENEVTVTVTGARPSLTEFGAHQTKKGVTYKIKKGSGRGFIPSGFVTFVRYGRGVFQRKQAASRRVPRGPLNVFTGPSIPQLFGSKRVMDKINEYIGQASRIFWSKVEWLRNK